ncbi:MAG TPA: zf-HC2 domain-containing protein [Gaiellaceae bacterium]|nr:zf-HC2 domain-containing protein [Gaiellaceae bacterium]
MIPARCERSRQSISLRLDGQLSLFESALLDRHLRVCAECRAFAADVVEQARLLRAAPLELPAQPVELALPVRRQPVRAAAVTLVGALAAAAAAFALVGPHPGGNAAASSDRLSGPRARVLVNVASPAGTDGLTSPASATVPANLDAVRGVFSLPV